MSRPPVAAAGVAARCGSGGGGRAGRTGVRAPARPAGRCCCCCCWAGLPRCHTCVGQACRSPCHQKAPGGGFLRSWATRTCGRYIRDGKTFIVSGWRQVKPPRWRSLRTPCPADSTGRKAQTHLQHVRGPDGVDQLRHQLQPQALDPAMRVDHQRGPPPPGGGAAPAARRAPARHSTASARVVWRLSVRGRRRCCCCGCGGGVRALFRRVPRVERGERRAVELGVGLGRRVALRTCIQKGKRVAKLCVLSQPSTGAQQALDGGKEAHHVVRARRAPGHVRAGRPQQRPREQRQRHDAARRHLGLPAVRVQQRDHRVAVEQAVDQQPDQARLAGALGPNHHGGGGRAGAGQVRGGGALHGLQRVAPVRRLQHRRGALRRRRGGGGGVGGGRLWPVEAEELRSIFGLLQGGLLRRRRRREGRGVGVAD